MLDMIPQGSVYFTVFIWCCAAWQIKSLVSNWSQSNQGKSVHPWIKLQPRRFWKNLSKKTWGLACLWVTSVLKLVKLWEIGEQNNINIMLEYIVWHTVKSLLKEYKHVTELQPWLEEINNFIWISFNTRLRETMNAWLHI